MEPPAVSFSLLYYVFLLVFLQISQICAQQENTRSNTDLLKKYIFVYAQAMHSGRNNQHAYNFSRCSEKYINMQNVYTLRTYIQ